MYNLSSVLYGALIGGIVGLFIRELLTYFVQIVCEKIILWRCKKLPSYEKLELIDSMIADLRTQRSLIGMVIIAFTETWDKTRPPTIQKEDEIK